MGTPNILGSFFKTISIQEWKKSFESYRSSILNQVVDFEVIKYLNKCFFAYIMQLIVYIGDVARAKCVNIYFLPATYS